MNLNLNHRYEKDVKVENYSSLVEESLITQRNINLGDIDPEAAEGLELMIRYWNLEDEKQKLPPEDRIPIKIFIDSGGGSVISAFTIIDTIRMSKTPIHTIVTGAAYSAGLEIAVAGHKRFAFPNASFLFHEGSTGGGRVDANKFKNFADFYKQLLERSKQLLIQHTKIDEKWYNEHSKDDVWFFVDEALEWGCIDEVLPIRA